MAGLDLEGFIAAADAADAKAQHSEKADKQKKAAAKAKADVVKKLVGLYGPGTSTLSQEDRDKGKEEIAVALLGYLMRDHGGDDLPDNVRVLVDLWLRNPDDKEKEKALTDAIKKLVVKVGAGKLVEKLQVTVVPAGGPAPKPNVEKDVGQVVDVIATAVKLYGGDLTEEERQRILEDSALKVITSNVIVEQLEWFVSENFMTYFAACRLGYSLGKPFGDRIAKDLNTAFRARFPEDVMVALFTKDDGWMTTVATDRSQTVQVTIEAGSFKGWHSTAFWDATVNAIRVQVVTNDGKAYLVNEQGQDVTGEPPASPAGETPAGGSSVFLGDPVKRDLAAEARDLALGKAGETVNQLQSQLMEAQNRLAHWQTNIDQHINVTEARRHIDEARTLVATLRPQYAAAVAAYEKLVNAPKGAFVVPRGTNPVLVQYARNPFAVAAAIVGLLVLGTVGVVLTRGGGSGSAAPAASNSARPAEGGQAAQILVCLCGGNFGPPDAAGKNPLLVRVQALPGANGTQTVVVAYSGPGMPGTATFSVPAGGAATQTYTLPQCGKWTQTIQSVNGHTLSAADQAAHTASETSC